MLFFESCNTSLRIRRRNYATRNAARADIFDFIELFYNSHRRHSHVGGVSPPQFEADYFERLQGVSKTLGIPLCWFADRPCLCGWKCRLTIDEAKAVPLDWVLY